MSRSGYSDDIDQWSLIRWRGQVASAIRGQRGQQFLKDLVVALEAMPVKELISEDLVDENEQVCALGALGKARGIDMTGIDPYNHEKLASTFGIAHQLACEVMFENDEFWGSSPLNRWNRMHDWALSHLKEHPDANT